MAPPRLDATLPPGTWDSHVHVVDENSFPFAPNAPYRPQKADLNDLLNFSRKIGVEHVCIVSISIYGTDNRCLLQSLRQLNGKARGVVGIDPETITDAELDEMHGLGVRGVRINLKSTGQELGRDVLGTVAERVRRLGWVVQVYVALEDIEKIADEVPKLGVPVVVDHLGSPIETKAPRLQAGYTAFMGLLRNKQVWVKLSGTYRFPDLPELDDYVLEILRIAPTQVVWASDWPHSGGVQYNPNGDRTKIQEYRKIDDPAFIARCKEWCGGDEDLIQKIFVDNPRRLWQYGDY